MRFFRRARRHQRDITPRENNNEVTGYRNMHLVAPLRWNLFSGRPYISPRHVASLFQFNPTITEHVPKCLGRVSHSEILQGERVENFSSDCWLQDHLHQFGYMSSSPQNLDNTTGLSSQMDDLDDDSESPSGSDVTSEFCDSLDAVTLNDSSSDISDGYFPHGRLTDISHYTAAVELPPYGSPSEPPPSYEEAIGLNERGSRSSNSTVSSHGAFLW